MADPHPRYVDLDDVEDEPDSEEDSDSQGYTDASHAAYVSSFDRIDDPIESDVYDSDSQGYADASYAAYVSSFDRIDEPIESDVYFEHELLPSRIESSSASPSNGDGKRKRIESQETAAFEGESSQASQWNANEIDGLFCPICLEAWTNDGEHYISCLPCGHIFGMSCIRKWLNQRQRQGKCPQCNAKCKLKDVRKLYMSQVVAVDEESQKRIRSLEAKCAYLEAELAKWYKRVEAVLTEKAESLGRENELLRETAELRRTIHQLLIQKGLGLVNATEVGERRYEFGDNILDGGSNGKTFGSNICGQVSSDKFRLEKELHVAGARLFDVDVSNQVLLIARRGEMGGVLTKMSLVPPYDTDDILLPSFLNSIKDLRISPSNSNLALFACLGKKLAVLSTESNNIIVSYDLPAAAWTCSWDLNDSNFIYAGLQNGHLLVFDMRQTSGPVESLKGLTSNPIHSVHSLSYNSALPSGVRTVMSASSIGLCLWNFGCAEKGPILVPETENQGVCISVTYCPSNDEIVASYRPKVEFTGETVFSQPALTPSRAVGQGTVGSHVLYKRAGSSSQFLKLGSSFSNVCDIGLPKSAIIDMQNRGRLFASEDKLSSELVLDELSSFTPLQRLKLQQNPVRDVKYTPAFGKGILSCLSGDTLHLFSTKLS